MKKSPDLYMNFDLYSFPPSVPTQRARPDLIGGDFLLPPELPHLSTTVSNVLDPWNLPIDSVSSQFGMIGAPRRFAPHRILPSSSSTSRQKVADPNHLLKITRKAVADETLAVLRKGSYTLPNGAEVDVTNPLKEAIERTVCFSPDYYFVEEVEARYPVMTVEVTEETTLQACERLNAEVSGDIGCLAFSSGKNPGGGFLGGSGGQEESIARSSGYYLCVIKDPQLYEYNRSHKDPFHSDHLIVSPNVPVIRDENDPYMLREPWLLTVIAAPAVNAGVVRARNVGNLQAESEIHRRMRNRIRRILGAAYEHGVQRLVLGEYGCGALENNPRDVVRYFKEELLNPTSPFACAFDRIIFAVHDDIGTQTCGRQRSPCLPDFTSEICPVGQKLFVKRDL